MYDSGTILVAKGFMALRERWLSIFSNILVFLTYQDALLQSQVKIAIVFPSASFEGEGFYMTK